MEPKLLTPVELRQQGFAVLVERLGVANALRFMREFEQGEGDYTKERDVLFEYETVEKLASKIRASRHEQGGTEVAEENREKVTETKADVQAAVEAGKKAYQNRRHELLEKAEEA